VSVTRGTFATILLGVALHGCGSTAPTIDLTGMEPPVRQLIESRTAALNKAPAAETWGALGDALLAHGLETEAADCYARAVESASDPFEWLYLQALAISGGASGPDRAIDLFVRALDLRPDDGLAQLRLALSQQGSGRHEDAERSFERALKLDPGLQRARRGWGQELLALGRYEAAIEALDRAVALEPRDAAGWSALAQAFAASGRDDQALVAARRARTGRELPGFSDPIWLAHVLQNGVSASRRFERAQRALGAGDIVEARIQVEAILDQRAEDADAHYLMGSIESRSGNGAEAERRFERALELNPVHVRGLLAWAALAGNAGRLEEARVLIERAGAVTPRDPSIVLALAENLRRSGDLEGAVEAYERLVELEPESARIRMNLGLIYEQTGRLAAAIETYARAVDLDPASPAAGRLESLDR